MVIVGGGGCGGGGRRVTGRQVVVVVGVGVSVSGVVGGLGGQTRVETRVHVIERSFG